jgi:hypothetical protein
MRFLKEILLLKWIGGTRNQFKLCFALNKPDYFGILSENKREVPHGEKKSFLCGLNLYFDNFHCEITTYNFHE